MRSWFSFMALSAVLPTCLGAQETDITDLARLTDGRQLYEIGCASCHGVDGGGAPPEQVGFDIPVPDFNDCSFASREPDADWIAVTHDGGPVRAFSETMPAFGEAFSEEQLQAIIDHTRTFCGDDRWPRGELNLPRPIFTEKAYPEDEAVWTLLVNTDGGGAVINQFVYEKRFGRRSQIEIKLPFGTRETIGEDLTGDWKTGVGDITLAVKHAFFHSLASGTIIAADFEVKLPTGSAANGFGNGTTVFEPFLNFGQILPANLFLHGLAGFEISTDTDRTPHEGFWRAVLGGSWARGFGRTWSPMLELLGSAPLEGGGSEWSIVPQLQMTLNKRQHVMLNVGVQVPLDDTDTRSTRLIMYILWDWFDGGLFDGW